MRIPDNYYHKLLDLLIGPAGPTLYVRLMFETSLRFAVFLATLGAMAGWQYTRPRRQLGDARRGRWPTNLGLALVNAIAVRVLAGGALFSAATFAADRGVGVMHWVPVPMWLGWIVTVLALDFAVYLQHVVFHALPILWRLHRVHHADLGFDATTGVRFHPIEILISVALKAAVVVLLGAVPWAAVAFEILLSSSSLFNHGNVAIAEGVDRRLRWFVVTPDMHRIHHSSRVVETNSNFGFSFSWWDRLCGTYRREPALGQLGLEIGLSEYREPLHLGRLLVLPFLGSAGSYTFSGTRAAEDRREQSPRRDGPGMPSRTPVTIPPSELRDRLSETDPPTVLDVRNADELRGPLGRLDGAVNIPLDDLPNRLDDLADRRARLLVPV
jgi:sterol desaturase/sphingolipid hydroxylase (fatty acid hydroxylase superfamily)